MLAFNKRFRSLILRGSIEENKGANAVKSIGLMVHVTHSRALILPLAREDFRQEVMIET